jgi:hypothetical protein
MEREFGVSAAKASDEMIFKRLDCSFGGVAAVYTRGDELEIDLGFVHVLFQST